MDKDKPDKPIAKTGLLTNYWKSEASKPSFWNKHALGTTNRNKPLFKDEIMDIFIDDNLREYAKTAINPKMQIALAIRHKFFNCTLSSLVKSNTNPIKQVVLLGSGYDTRAIRKNKYGVNYFEIDHATVLESKKRLYESKMINKNATYIGIDYIKYDFIKELQLNNINFNLPTYFIWEGNTMYIEVEKIKEILVKIKNNFLNNSTISFDYFSEHIVNKTTGIIEADQMVDRFKEIKAPMISVFSNIENIAKECGLEVTENIKCSDLTKKYKIDDRPFPTQDYYYFCTLK